MHASPGAPGPTARLGSRDTLGAGTQLPEGSPRRAQLLLLGGTGLSPPPAAFILDPEAQVPGGAAEEIRGKPSSLPPTGRLDFSPTPGTYWPDSSIYSNIPSFTHASAFLSCSRPLFHQCFLIHLQAARGRGVTAKHTRRAPSPGELTAGKGKRPALWGRATRQEPSRQAPGSEPRPTPHHRPRRGWLFSESS